jgi:superfamily I DNA/RNA helicase
MSAPTTDIVLPAWVAVDPASSMAVSAGAGSGKTTSLVGRVAALVATPGVQPSDLVVITFTEKAAREVSHRLRESLGGSVALDEGGIRSRRGCLRSSRPRMS